MAAAAQPHTTPHTLALVVLVPGRKSCLREKVARIQESGAARHKRQPSDEDETINSSRRRRQPSRVPAAGWRGSSWRSQESPSNKLQPALASGRLVVSSPWHRASERARLRRSMSTFASRQPASQPASQSRLPASFGWHCQLASPPAFGPGASKATAISRARPCLLAASPPRRQQATPFAAAWRTPSAFQ